MAQIRVNDGLMNLCTVSWQVNEYGKVSSWPFQATLSALCTLNSLFKSEGLSLVLEECFQLLSLPRDWCPKLEPL